jgi:predicted PurR-regulated permease PerM
MTIRRIATIAGIVTATLAGVYLLWVFRQAIVLFVFSLAIAAAARPMVETLNNRGIPRPAALIITYLLFLGIIVVALLAVGGSLLNEIQLLADSLARTYDRIWTQWPKGTPFQQTIVQQLPAPADLYQSFSPEQRNSALSGLLGVTVGSVSFLAQIVTILILSIYWTVDRFHFERLWLSILPVESRTRSRDIWRDIERDFGAYVRSELLQSIFAGILLGVGLWALRIPYPILLAIFGAIAWLLPWLGGVLAVLPIAVAGFSLGLWPGIYATGFAIAVLFFLEFFIEPRFMERRRFSPLLSILLIIALVEPFGLLGFIIAPPLAAVIELLFRYNVQNRPSPDGMETIERISQLRTRMDQLHEMINKSEKPVEPYLGNMLSRIEALINRADVVLGKEKPPAPVGATGASNLPGASGPTRR